MREKHYTNKADKFKQTEPLADKTYKMVKHEKSINRMVESRSQKVKQRVSLSPCNKLEQLLAN